jgi:hypothetical protein
MNNRDDLVYDLQLRGPRSESQGIETIWLPLAPRPMKPNMLAMSVEKGITDVVAKIGLSSLLMIC